MMGCKKERAAKDASSDASNPFESGMHWTLTRLLPILCLSVLCLALLLYMKNPATRRKIFLCAATSFCLVFGSKTFFESWQTWLSPPKLFYIINSLILLAFTMQITGLQRFANFMRKKSEQHAKREMVKREEMAKRELKKEEKKDIAHMTIRDSATTSTHQDNDEESVYSPSKSTLQRNCSRFCMLLVFILMIITAIRYMSSSTLQVTASKETHEFSPRTGRSRVLIPTRNDIQTEGRKKELEIIGTTEHAGSFRESMRINSSGTTDAKLRIVVPIKKGFHEFIKIYNPPKENHSIVTGFVVDVFNEAMRTLHNQVSWEFIPYQTSHEDAIGYYDKLAHQINLKSQEQSYDVVVGDVTMTANRLKCGDFSPYLPSGVSMIVPIEEDNDANSLWWFFKPFSPMMWIVTSVFFLSKGILLLVLEHKTNPVFQVELEHGTIPDFIGTIAKILETILSFSFSTVTLRQKKNLEHWHCGFIIHLWILGPFIIIAAYNANLGLMLSNGTPQVTTSDIKTLIENGDNVGYPSGSFVFKLLKQWGFHESKLKAYATEKEYAKALSLGSAKNGVSAIVDEIPYIGVFLTRYGHGYAMGGLNDISAGDLGFVFPKGSKIKDDISEAILQLREAGTIYQIRERRFGPLSCSGGPPQAPESFKKQGFLHYRGLLLITGPATCAALLLSLLMWSIDIINPQWETIESWFVEAALWIKQWFSEAARWIKQWFGEAAR